MVAGVHRPRPHLHLPEPRAPSHRVPHRLAREPFASRLPCTDLMSCERARVCDINGMEADMATPTTQSFIVSGALVSFEKDIDWTAADAEEEIKELAGDLRSAIRKLRKRASAARGTAGSITAESTRSIRSSSSGTSETTS